MRIEVKITTFKIRTIIVADNDANFIQFNGKTVNFDANEFIKEILSIVVSWKENMINNRIIDGESYSIKISEGLQEKSYNGKNYFPENYSKFSSLIRRVSEC